MNVNKAKSAETRFQPKLNLTFLATSLPFAFSLAASPWIWSRVFVRSSGYVAKTNEQTYFDFKHVTLNAITYRKCLPIFFSRSFARPTCRYCCCVSLNLNFHNVLSTHLAQLYLPTELIWCMYTKTCQHNDIWPVASLCVWCLAVRQLPTVRAFWQMEFYMCGEMKSNKQTKTVSGAFFLNEVFYFCLLNQSLSPQLRLLCLWIAFF